MLKELLKLSKVGIDKEKEAEFKRELDKVISYVKHIESIPNLDKLEPLFHLNSRNTLREDIVNNFDNIKDIELNFPMNNLLRLTKRDD